jgi:hypothetical protein
MYGDSHAQYSFRNLELPHTNLCEYSITMHRVGRDNIIANFNKDEVLQNNNILVFVYGEIDCRCHIQKQINLGNDEDTVIKELVTNYFTTIKNNVIKDNLYNFKVIIVGVIPPVKQTDYEMSRGPLPDDFPFPFVGTDEDRVRFNNKVNKLLEDLSNNNGCIYFNPYTKHYTRPCGTLKFELSDGSVHLANNSFFLEEFIALYKSFGV